MENSDFVVHGVYSWSNCCGCEVQINQSNDGARLRFPGKPAKVTDWFEIEHVPNDDDERDENGELELVPVIDPDGHYIPLGLVMRAG